MEIAIGVEPADITCVQPSAGKGSLGFFGTFPISLHDERPAHADFASFTRRNRQPVSIQQRQIKSSMRCAAGPQTIRPRHIMLLTRQIGDAGWSFGLAVKLLKDQSKSLDCLDQPRHRHRRGAIKNRFHRGQIKPMGLGMIDQTIDHCGHHERRPNVILPHIGCEAVGVESWQHMKGAAIKPCRIG